MTIKLRTATNTLDALNRSIDGAKRRTPHVKIDKATLFALITDHRDLCAIVERATGTFIEG